MRIGVDGACWANQRGYGRFAREVVAAMAAAAPNDEFVCFVDKYGPNGRDRGRAMTAPLIFTPEYYARMRDLEASGWWSAGMREVARKLFSLVTLPNQGTMLDVGCGSGQTMSWFGSLYPGWNTYGLDLAVEALLAARRCGEGAIVAASALEIPLADESVDMVVTLDVVQHLPLPAGDTTALREMNRVLRPAAHLFVRTNAQAFPTTVDDPIHSFHKYRTRELTEKLEASGFEVLRLSRINAVLGLAEIPRELRATKDVGAGYHGLLAEIERSSKLTDAAKRSWLRLEGWAVAHGLRIPFGRTHVALCRKRT